ncbi:peptidylprolyl isomerase [Rhodoferax sp.]|uniref:peptidylprolyl isomerase n=1 Tax=Rhodoferax sp. TaxID=50421 RepID=UPI00283D57A7|nr:peptidylprolyl isomerase [Rhodoferax sp.]MDR3369243.1 peptidylprolyl isomerase [Rhodoferax sp.]
MTYRPKTFSLAALALVALSQAQTQGLHIPDVHSPSPVATKLSTAQADFIVAVVNSEPITNIEVQRETQREYQQLVQQHRAPPDARVLLPEVLEGLINRKAQLQLARETGLRVEESAIDQAEQSIAAQNQFDVAELHQRVQQEGQSISEFRNQLSDQILLQRLRERDVDAHVKVNEQDIDQFLQEQKTVMDSGDVEINLAQILVAVPESASPTQVDALKLRAQRALDRARKGEDFAALVKEFSDASDLANGGQLGLRSTSRYPELFVKATHTLGVGDVADLVRSPAGFHVLKVIEKVRPDLPTMAVTQSHARHILLVPSAHMSEAEAVRKLADLKKQIVSNQADFAALAREYSQDGSAAQGGDLGWASPGMFVPEFETAMNRLAPGEVSDPLVSRFGVHLIQLLERRKVSLTQEQQREAARAVLREKKIQEAYRTWVQDIRARAYVEMREPPQ